MTPSIVSVTARGARRWRRGHPWIYRSDVIAGPETPGIVRVLDAHERCLGQGLWSPASEIRVRMLTRTATPIDTAFWAERIRAALARRRDLRPPATAFRVLNGEADGAPSLIVDRYDTVVAAQLLSAGLETQRAGILEAIREVLQPEAIVLRHDASVRRHENLLQTVEIVRGEVHDAVPVTEGPVTYLAAPLTGQKTGAFLDQRENRALVASVAAGRAADLFCYHGLFALHMAPRVDSVVGVDQSAPALHHAERNRVLNGYTNVTWVEANVFDLLRQWDEAGERFDTLVLDPPAFARDKASVPAALRGYREINRRALRLLAPGGHLFTASCSYHVGREPFLAMLRAAAADAGREIILRATTGQPADHPELLTIPETGYLKGALLHAAL